MTDPRTPRLTDLFKTALRAAASELRVALPGRVERYDPTTQKVDVLPLLQDQVAAEDGTESAVSLPVIPAVPVVFPGAGNFRITFPVAVGDTVLLVFTDRSLDKWLASDGSAVVDPGVLNQHHLTDAVAIPGLRPFGKPLASPPTDHATLGQEGGLQVHFKGTTVEVGSAADAAALASKVLARLNALETAFNGHSHATSCAVGPGTASAPPIPTATPSTDVSSATLKLQG